MTRLRLLNRQALAGLLFLALGAAALLQAGRYPIGTARRMGPGFFPVVIATL